MKLSKLFDYINPGSKSYAACIKKFDELTHSQKKITLIISCIVAILTIIPFFGVLGFVSFHTLVDYFGGKNITV